MNKLMVFIIALLLVFYFSYGIFNVGNTKKIIETPVSSNIKIIQPPTLLKSEKFEDVTRVYQHNNHEIIEGKNNLTAKQVRTKENRKQLSDLYTSKNVNYTSLGDVIETIQSNDNSSEELTKNLDRIKHNLVIAKKIAALTKRLHVDKGGKRKVLDQSVLDELIGIQKQFVFPVYTVKNRGEN